MRCWVVGLLLFVAFCVDVESKPVEYDSSVESSGIKRDNDAKNHLQNLSQITSDFQSFLQSHDVRETIAKVASEQRNNDRETSKLIEQCSDICVNNKSQASLYGCPCEDFASFLNVRKKQDSLSSYSIPGVVTFVDEGDDTDEPSTASQVHQRVYQKEPPSHCSLVCVKNLSAAGMMGCACSSADIEHARVFLEVHGEPVVKHIIHKHALKEVRHAVRKAKETNRRPIGKDRDRLKGLQLVFDSLNAEGRRDEMETSESLVEKSENSKNSRNIDTDNSNVEEEVPKPVRSKKLNKSSKKHVNNDDFDSESNSDDARENAKELKMRLKMAEMALKIERLQKNNRAVHIDKNDDDATIEASAERTDSDEESEESSLTSVKKHVAALQSQLEVALKQERVHEAAILKQKLSEIHKKVASDNSRASKLRSELKTLDERDNELKSQEQSLEDQMNTITSSSSISTTSSTVSGNASLVSSDHKNRIQKAKTASTAAAMKTALELLLKEPLDEKK